MAAAVGGAVGAEADGARGPQDQCVHGRHGGAGRVGDGERHRVGPGRGEPDADRAGAGGVQGHAVPGERQPSLGVGFRAGGAGHTGGVQGRVQQGRVEAEAGGIGCGPSGHDGLGEQLVAAPPDRVQALEGGTVGESARREAVVQSVEGEGFGAGRRPGHRPVGLGAVRAVLGQDAFGVPGPLVAVGVTVDGCVRPGVQAERAVAQGVGGAHGEAQHGAAVFGQHQGASRVNSSTRGQPTRAPAWSASSRKAVPGSSARPPTAWSASHGWVRADRRPVRSRPSLSARTTTAPSSGWSAGSARQR